MSQYNDKISNALNELEPIFAVFVFTLAYLYLLQFTVDLPLVRNFLILLLTIATLYAGYSYGYRMARPARGENS